MTSEEFYNSIKESADLTRIELAGKVAAAIFRSIRTWVDEREVKEISKSLPPKIRTLWDASKPHAALTRASAGAEFGFVEFLELVQAELGLSDLGQSETMSRSVFRALKNNLPELEILHISDRLPVELRNFWLAA